LRRVLGDQPPEPCDVLVRRPGVDDDAKEILAQEIDDQVVENAAVRSKQARVKGLARYLQLVDIVRKREPQEIARAGSDQINGAHVRHVEHARVAPHRMVLFDLRTVVDGHVPATEIDHARTRGAVAYRW
jgi:hypothetical protein